MSKQLVKNLFFLFVKAALICTKRPWLCIAHLQMMLIQMAGICANHGALLK